MRDRAPGSPRCTQLAHGATDLWFVEWFDLAESDCDDPHGVLEVSCELTPKGLALEFQVQARDPGTFGCWLFEDGRLLRVVWAATA